MSFLLNPVLKADTAAVCDLPLCRVLLMNDRRFPWLILVPRKPALRDLADLPPADDPQVMAEIRQATAALIDRHRPDKINVAALGNQVSQLHIHVIARVTTDPAWPGPVWGAGIRQPYAAGAMAQAVADLSGRLGGALIDATG